MPPSEALYDEHGDGVGHDLQCAVDHVVDVEVSAELGRV